MRTCVRVVGYVGVCTCVYMCVHECTRVCMCVYGCTWVRLCEHVCSWVYACVCLCARECVNLWICVYVYTNVGVLVPITARKALPWARSWRCFQTQAASPVNTFRREMCVCMCVCVRVRARVCVCAGRDINHLRRRPGAKWSHSERQGCCTCPRSNREQQSAIERHGTEPCPVRCAVESHGGSGAAREKFRTDHDLGTNKISNE